MNNHSLNPFNLCSPGLWIHAAVSCSLGFCFSSRCIAASITGPDASPFAQVQPLGPGGVHWTQGFWADRFELCRQKTAPALWSIMAGTNHTQFYQNFRIAAGLAEGRHRGAPFNDGEFYKWLEGACAVVAVSREPEMEQHIEQAVGVIAKAQRADGYIHTPVLIAELNAASSAPSPQEDRTGVNPAGDSKREPFQNPLDFEMYNMGHLFTAACEHYRVTGRTNFLALAVKAADFLCQTFKQPTPELAHNAICPSHYMGIVEIYRATREMRYLELARKLLEMRHLIEGGGDDNQDRIPFEQQTNAMGHAVRANYLYAGAADLFLETGNRELWKPLERIWTNVVQQKMYLTGGCGALYDGASPDGAKDQKSITRVHQAYGRNYQLPNLTAHSETCANIGNVLWNWRMFLATGDAKFMDVLELALYNSVLSGVDLSGTNFFYVNPLRSVQPLRAALRWQHQRVPFLNSFCCPPNLARTVAQTSGYACAKSQNAIWVNLYGGSTLTTKLGDGQTLMLDQETDYPWNGHMRFKFSRCGPVAFSLKLRIPAWSKNATVRLNGRPTDADPKPGSYFELQRNWHPGDVVELDLPLPARLMEANPLVEETANQVAIQRGPIVYCLESTDLPNDTMSVLDVVIPRDIRLRARHDQTLPGNIVVLEGKAFVRAASTWKGRLYRELQPAPLKTANIRLIPYFAWGNRGVSEMSVWLRLLAK